MCVCVCGGAFIYYFCLYIINVFSNIFFLITIFFSVGGRGDCLKSKQYARLSNEVKYKNATTYKIQSISKYVNNFLSTNRTTLILSSLVSEFDKESYS